MAKSGSSVTPTSSLSTHHSHQSFQKSCAEVLQHRGMSPWMNAERPRILCPWLELARQHTTVPSLIYPASQQVLLVWAQCYVNIAVWLLNWSWFVCLASLEYGLTELMSEWIICLHMPVLSIVNAKAQFPLQKMTCLLNFRVMKELTTAIIILSVSEMTCFSFYCRIFSMIGMIFETWNVWENCIFLKKKKKSEQLFLLSANC